MTTENEITTPYVARQNNGDVKKSYVTALVEAFKAGRQCIITAIGAEQERRALTLLIAANEELQNQDDSGNAPILSAIPYRSTKIVDSKEHTVTVLFIVDYFGIEDTDKSDTEAEFAIEIASGHMTNTWEDPGYKKRSKGRRYFRRRNMPIRVEMATMAATPEEELPNKGSNGEEHIDDDAYAGIGR